MLAMIVNGIVIGGGNGIVTMGHSWPWQGAKVMGGGVGGMRCRGMVTMKVAAEIGESKGYVVVI